MSKYLHRDDAAKAIAIPRVFSENSRAKNGEGIKLTKIICTRKGICNQYSHENCESQHLYGGKRLFEFKNS